MSTHVVTEFKTKPQRAEELVHILNQALPDSLVHDGCEAIALRRNQDDATNIVSFTQWASRRHYEDYLAWRTETGLTGDLGDLLVEPMSVRYFDDVTTLSR